MQGSASNPVWRIDAVVQRAAQDSTVQASPTLRNSVRAMNWWGGDGVVWLAALLWLGGRALGRNTVARVGLRGAEALAVASAISGIIKGLAGRARPFVTPGEPWNWDFNHGWSDARYFSMPSGHTTAATAFAIGIALATTGWSRGRRAALAVPAVLSILLVAAARILADQHWLSDTAVAMTLGSLTSFVLARIHERRAPSGYDRVMLGADAVPTSVTAPRS
jgi:undecaprenyl-diphosphatase